MHKRRVDTTAGHLVRFDAPGGETRIFLAFGARFLLILHVRRECAEELLELELIRRASSSALRPVRHLRCQTVNQRA